ncbi:MAG: hypothetical protein ACSHX8_15775 [Opitutaceae bacterium]
MTHRNYLSLLLILCLSGASAQAIVLSLSGEVNITIPNDFDGVYLDFTDVSDATAYTTSSTEPLSWDINPFFGGAAVGTSNTFLPVLENTTTNSDILNLSFGTEVGSSSVFPSSYSGSSGHMGTGSLEFESGTSGYIGFALVDGVDAYYGWMRLTLYDDGSAGTIHEWAWNTTVNESITVGAVPEPSHATLLLGLSAILWGGARRRNRKA